MTDYNPGADPDDPTWQPHGRWVTWSHVHWDWADITERAWATAWQNAIPAFAAALPTFTLATRLNDLVAIAVAVGVAVAQGLIGFFLSVAKNMRKQKLEAEKAKVRGTL
jgi:hypothetical protein